MFRLLCFSTSPCSVGIRRRAAITADEHFFLFFSKPYGNCPNCGQALLLRSLLKHARVSWVWKSTLSFFANVPLKGCRECRRALPLCLLMTPARVSLIRECSPVAHAKSQWLRRLTCVRPPTLAFLHVCAECEGVQYTACGVQSLVCLRYLLSTVGVVAICVHRSILGHYCFPFWCWYECFAFNLDEQSWCCSWLLILMLMMVLPSWSGKRDMLGMKAPCVGECYWC